MVCPITIFYILFCSVRYHLFHYTCIYIYWIYCCCDVSVVVYYINYISIYTIILIYISLLMLVFCCYLWCFDVDMFIYYILLVVTLLFDVCRCTINILWTHRLSRPKIRARVTTLVLLLRKNLLSNFSDFVWKSQNFELGICLPCASCAHDLLHVHH